MKRYKNGKKYKMPGSKRRELRALSLNRAQGRFAPLAGPRPLGGMLQALAQFLHIRQLGNAARKTHDA